MSFFFLLLDPEADSAKRYFIEQNKWRILEVTNLKNTEHVEWILFPQLILLRIYVIQMGQLLNVTLVQKQYSSKL